MISPIPHEGGPAMADFLLRDLDPYVVQRLREQAERNHRSLQAEIHAVLQQATKLSKEESLALIEELQARSPLLPDSTPIIREARDDR